MRTLVQRPRPLLIVIAALLFCAGIGGVVATPTGSASPLPPALAQSKATPPVQPSSSGPDQLCGNWTYIAEGYPTNIAGSGVVAVGNYLYSFGGDDSIQTTAAAYRYDGTTWTAIAPLPVPFYDPSVTTDGSYIYISAASALWRYDPGTDTYTTLAPSTWAATPTGFAYLGGNLYLIGGATPASIVQVYNIAANSWSNGPPLPPNTGGSRALTLGGFIYLGPGGGTGTKTYRFDGTTWDDAAIADTPPGRYFHGGYAAGVLNGEIILAGGGEGGLDPYVVATWDPGTNAWTIQPRLPYPAQFTAGDTLNGIFYVVGGVPRFGFDPARIVQRFNQQACVPPPTPTPCTLTFADVPTSNPFYAYVRCLTCRGIITGYQCGGEGEPCPGSYFRPPAESTRGQIAKIIADAAGWNEPPLTQAFEDVVPGNSPFYWEIQRLALRGIVGGYPCGGPGEPCVAPDNRPYFRPNTPVTRGQTAKMDGLAAGWTDTPTSQTFEDVPPGSTFYLYIERAATRSVISGYPCGGPGEPCVAPGNRAYFRPGTNVTRAQTAKIVANSFFPNCQTPQR